MSLLVGGVVVVGALVLAAIWWWLTRLQRDLGEISQAWRDTHGRDQGTKGGPR